jgi:hypothetical protein
MEEPDIFGPHHSGNMVLRKGDRRNGKNIFNIQPEKGGGAKLR